MAEKKILIAEDEPEVLNILEKKFRARGYEVLAVANGEEAFNRCRAYNPDLLLLDIAMPKIDGYTLAQNFRKDKAFKETPIIFMTAKELEFSGIQKRLTELGNCDFITKPCIFEALLAKVSAIIEKK